MSAFVKFMVCFGLFTAPIVADARSVWEKMRESELRCQATCSRVGMENVVFQRSRQSVCAQRYKGEVYPGANPPTGEMTCRSIINGKEYVAPTGEFNFCLCVDDGVPRGSDYAWVTGASNCQATCRKAAPDYRYATYASALPTGWMNVCANAKGQIGYTFSEAKDSRERCTTSRNDERFGCLCMQMFAGDLDAQLDP